MITVKRLRFDYKLYITDEAFDWHVQTANALGYVRGELTAHGVGKFFDTLAKLPYMDNRHPGMQSTDQWSSGLMPARRRMVSVSVESMIRFGLIAREFSIPTLRSQNPIRTGYYPKVPNEFAYLAPDILLISPVLEAIGLRWLAPVVVIPRASPALYAQKSRARKRTVKRYTSLDY